MSLVAPLGAAPNEGAALAVRVSRLEMTAPGRIAISIEISGFEPNLHPTIESAIKIGGQVIEGSQQMAVAGHLPVLLDLPAGTARLGGVEIFHFTPVPPFNRNTPVAIVVTVRQANDVATASQAGVFLLPTVVVPGYLNDLGAQPDDGVLSVLERRGYRVVGGAPTLFWFTYASRRANVEAAARALTAYLRGTVLPSVYAARVNVIGYSEGGLLARWNLAFDPDWAHLVRSFVMVGVPNQGAVGSYLYGWYPALASLAATPAARDMLPAYPYWRPDDQTQWTVPPDGRNATLERLNARPLPEDVQIYAFYGSSARLTTWSGLTGALPDVTYSYGPGDGIVLAASVLGLPINGGGGIPGFPERMYHVDLGPVGHLSLLRAAIPKIADVLTER